MEWIVLTEAQANAVRGEYNSRLLMPIAHGDCWILPIGVLEIDAYAPALEVLRDCQIVIKESEENNDY